MAVDARGEFDASAQHVDDRLRQVSKLVSEVRFSETSAELSTTQSKVRNEFAEVTEELKDLRSLAKEFSARERGELIRRVERFETDLTSLRADFERESTRASRDVLLGAGGGQLSEEERRKREANMAATTRLDRGTRKLLESRQLMNESTDTGLATIETLDSQANSLTTALDATRDVNMSTEDARQTLIGMISRTWRNKICLMGSVGLLIIANLLVVYFGYIAK